MFDWKKYQLVAEIFEFASYQKPLTKEEIDEITLADAKKFQIKLRESPQYKKFLSHKEKGGDIPKDVIDNYLKLIPNPDKIYRDIIGKKRQLRHDSINPNGALFWKRIGILLLVVLSLVIGFALRISFENLSFLPHISPIVGLFITAATALLLFDKSLTWFALVLIPELRKKGRDDDAEYIKHTISNGKNLFYSLITMVGIFAISHQDIFNNMRVIGDYSELFHSNPEMFDRNSKISKFEHYEIRYKENINYFLSYAFNKPIQAFFPIGKLGSYGIISLCLTWVLFSIHNLFRVPEPNHQSILFSFFIFFVALCTLSLYPDRFFGLNPEAVGYRICGIYLVACWYFYFKILNPYKEWEPKQNEQESPRMEYLKSNLNLRGVAGVGYTDTKQKNAAIKTDERRARSRNFQERVEAEERTRPIEKKSEMNGQTRELDKERRRNDDQPDNVWTRYYDRKNKKNNE